MKLVDATSAASYTSSTVKPGPMSRGKFVYVQVDISAAATVQIQGRYDDDMAWIPLKEFTATGADTVILAPRIRFVVTGNTGVVSAAVDGVAFA